MSEQELKEAKRNAASDLVSNAILIQELSAQIEKGDVSTLAVFAILKSTAEQTQQAISAICSKENLIEHRKQAGDVIKKINDKWKAAECEALGQSLDTASEIPT